MENRIRPQRNSDSANVTESKTRKTQETRKNGSRLERARAYVKRMWFPINQALYGKIRQGVEEGIYDLDLDFLLVELKTDFALFTRCLQYLSEMLALEGVGIPSSVNPIELIHLAGIERLKEILSDETLFHTDHSLDTISKEQSKRFQEAAVCSSTAELLSDKHNIDPDVGFSVGLLRQLGLTLIAWNYPNAYARALSNIDQGSNLDDSLSSILGFSPALLAVSLVKEWGLGGEIRTALGDPGIETKTPLQKNVQEGGLVLRNICEVGEALARANDPEIYPSAVSDWENAASQIRDYLGSDGLRQIQKKIEENTKNYVASFPEVFSGIAKIDPGNKVSAFQSRNYTNKNPYFAKCRPIVRRNLDKYYKKISASEIQADNIRFLVKDIFPLAGFLGGCIFIIDPTSSQLIPRMNSGELKLLNKKSVNCAPGTTDTTPISTAFFCNIPIIGTDETAESKINYISGTLGNKKKAGVLYVEFSAKDQESLKQSSVLNTFKALRQALCDGLKLS